MQRLLSTLFLILALAAANAKGGLPQGLGQEASVGVYIKDLKTGKVLADENAQKSFTPASIQKSLPVAAALTKLGPDYRFTTTVTLEGKRQGNQLRGNVVINPSGDPTIGGRGNEDDGFVKGVADAIAATGIKSITGTVIVDDKKWPDKGFNPNWEISDSKYDYGVGWWPMNFHHNMVLVRGRKKRSSWQPTKNPSSVVTSKIIAALKAKGITVGKTPIANPKGKTELVYTFTSEPLSELARDLMHRSDNLMAEAVLRALAPGKSRQDAIDAEFKILKEQGANLGKISQYDGSGLARSNSLTPRAMGSLLEAMAGNQTYVDVFPRAGCDGTVKKFLKDTPFEGCLAVKSGSMKRVVCYAGYLTDENGAPTHVVVLMVNGSVKSGNEIRKSLQEFLLKTL
ncbi:MAG: D-alanyl-D-alanine carboxypeptidase/D-alanyl-D-alanine-endopeptidase [Muribaculaceae bacterium]|nr:D-alanyl-D-alanine carboxypeptidase/D-alanyl-D-alanine-endopeptidase [Muribaculaceae bacterium]MDE6321840.1 D-alanyl-D-alanine carboxypeptidase/D-alanyl-D-alanine-endopeptidase [Muribaculaceae bacterium]